MTSEMWMILRPQLMASAPHLVAYLAAFICAVVLRNRCLRAAILAAVGSAVLFLNVLAGTFSSAYIMGMQRSGAITIEQYATIIAVFVLVRSVFAVCGFGLVFVSVFIGRSKPTHP